MLKHELKRVKYDEWILTAENSEIAFSSRKCAELWKTDAGWYVCLFPQRLEIKWIGPFATMKEAEETSIEKIKRWQS